MSILDNTHIELFILEQHNLNVKKVTVLVELIKETKNRNSVWSLCKQLWRASDRSMEVM